VNDDQKAVGIFTNNSTGKLNMLQRRNTRFWKDGTDKYAELLNNSSVPEAQVWQRTNQHTPLHHGEVPGAHPGCTSSKSGSTRQQSGGSQLMGQTNTNRARNTPADPIPSPAIRPIIIHRWRDNSLLRNRFESWPKGLTGSNRQSVDLDATTGTGRHSSLHLKHL